MDFYLPASNTVVELTSMFHYYPARRSRKMEHSYFKQIVLQAADYHYIIFSKIPDTDDTLTAWVAESLDRGIRGRRANTDRIL